MCSEAAWPNEFADFKRLDAVLKCGICYDYMTNSMITSCSHTYCSLCIRKFMQYKNQCPACFEETYEIHLRNNRPLDEVITIFVKMKEKLQRALRLATIVSTNAKEPAEDSPNVLAKTPKNSSKTFTPKTPSALRGTAGVLAVQLFKNPEDSSAIDLSGEDATVGSCGSTTSLGSSSPCKKILGSSNPAKTALSIQGPSDKTSAGEDIVVNGVKIPGIFNPPVVFPKAKKPDEMAQCPVCHVDVPARNINIHLDACLAAESDVCQKKEEPKKRPLLPKRLYHLMQDKGLKKVCKEYGLSTNGDRKTLISRIQRYTVLYNAENDSPNPRPVSELIAQVERQEREEKRPCSLVRSLAKQQQQRIVVDRKADPEIIDQANKAYREENRDSFAKLIEQMKAREGKIVKPAGEPSMKPLGAIQEDFDPNRPSTSRDDMASELATAADKSSSVEGSTKEETSAGQISYDSDSDIFEIEPPSPPQQRGLIDWNKTHIEEQDTQCPAGQGQEDGGEADDFAYLPREDKTITLSDEVITGKSDENVIDNPKSPIMNHESDKNHILNSSEQQMDASDDDCFEFSRKTPSRRNVLKSAESTDEENVSRRKPFRRKSLSVKDGDGSILEEYTDKAEHIHCEDSLTPQPRSTRRSTRSTTKTPTSSIRSRKRKSKSSPVVGSSPDSQNSDERLSEVCEGSRAPVDEDSSSSSSNSVGLDDLPGSPVRKTRRSLRYQGAKSSIDDSINSSARLTRKRAKRDLSPAY